MTSYATEAQYRLAAGGSPPAAGDTTLAEDLEAASRTVDGWTGAPPGGWAPADDTTRTYWPTSGTGRNLIIGVWRSVASVALVTADGVRTVLDAGDYAVADAGGIEDARILRRLRRLWPAGSTVEISGDAGPAAVPKTITRATIIAAHRERDVTKGGAAQVIAALDSGVKLHRPPADLWHLLRPYCLDFGR